jgi:hypothetical protein
MSLDSRVADGKNDLAVCARFVDTINSTLTVNQFLKVIGSLTGHREGKPFGDGLMTG